jgi:hypothetical protein
MKRSSSSDKMGGRSMNPLFIISSKETTMGRKRAKRSFTRPNETLARLRRLYNRQPQLQYNEFGRRIALPSEIANHLKQNKPAASTY